MTSYQRWTLLTSLLVACLCCALVNSAKPPGKSLKAGSGKSFSSAEDDSSVAAASSAKKEKGKQERPTPPPSSNSAKVKRIPPLKG